MGAISRSLFEKARQIIPGGVNSPVRAFKAVGGDPPFFARGLGALLWDVDGNEYVDYVCSWGPLILGHAHPEIVRVVQETVKDGTPRRTMDDRVTIKSGESRLVVERGRVAKILAGANSPPS